MIPPKITPTITVMVVDDHPMWRDGVARDLAEQGFDVTATAGDADAAVRIAATVRPDVVLMDLNLGSVSGVEAIRRITGALADTRVLVLSASGEHSDVLEAVKAGASGYLVKSASAPELVAAVRRTAAGDTVFTPGLAGLVLGEYRRMAAAPEEVQAPKLTDRETEILRLMAGGYSNKEIANSLGVAEGTVKNHVSNILSKLGVRDRTRAVLKAFELGIV